MKRGKSTKKKPGCKKPCRHRKRANRAYQGHCEAISPGRNILFGSLVRNEADKKSEEVELLERKQSPFIREILTRSKVLYGGEPKLSQVLLGRQGETPVI